MPLYKVGNFILSLFIKKKIILSFFFRTSDGEHVPLSQLVLFCFIFFPQFIMQGKKGVWINLPIQLANLIETTAKVVTCTDFIILS